MITAGKQRVTQRKTHGKHERILDPSEELLHGDDLTADQDGVMEDVQPAAQDGQLREDRLGARS
jgi:hypothetical protein